MITIGLVTWSDHPALIHDGAKKLTLSDYAEFFPTVEVDSPFYGIPSIKTVENWQSQVPSKFQFILKANYLMTKHHLRQFGPATEEDWRQAFVKYFEMLQPLIKANQLKTVLFQFPPYFKLGSENIQYLRKVRQLMGNIPIAVEFRNPTWFGEEITKDTADFLKSLKMTEVIVDEPHNLNRGVPFVPLVTTKKLALIRLQGRNQKGWFGDNEAKNPKLARTMYCYSHDELEEIAKVVGQLSDKAEEVCVIFNNNGNHDAAPNALELKKILGLKFGGLSPMQLDLF